VAWVLGDPDVKPGHVSCARMMALRLGDPHQEIKTWSCLLCQNDGLEAWRSASGNKNPAMSIVPEGWH